MLRQDWLVAARLLIASRTIVFDLAPMLAADARIAAFHIETGEGGPQVTATVDASWLIEQRRASQEDISRRLLRQWRFIYDRNYRRDRKVQAPNFDVWISAFTQRQISADQMQIWLDAILAQLRCVPHEKVLDVGCGIGLILAALAPGTVAYEATDLSEEAISSLNAWTGTQPSLEHVRLSHAPAHEIALREGPAADLAILNSVAQYFPDSSYLMRVLQAVVQQIAPGGAIFLGDVRALGLLRMRALNVAAAQAGARSTVREIRAEADFVLAATRELSIDPGFFQTTGDALPRCGHVQFAMKPLGAERDLSGYRYDVMLRLDAPNAPPAPVIDGRRLVDILAMLAEDAPVSAALLDLPNLRLAEDVALASALEVAPGDALLSAVIANLNPMKSDAIEPETLVREARALGYVVEVRFTPSAHDGRFDALLLRDGIAARWPDGEFPHRVANDPLGAELVATLRQELLSSIEAACGGLRPDIFNLNAPEQTGES